MIANYIPSFSFIIFTYNSSDLILINLQHLYKTIKYYPIDYEIILVDNNSNDNTLEIVNKFQLENDFQLKIIKNPVQGLSYSRKEGIKVVSKEFVCFVDDDNFLSENWIELLVKIIKDHNPDVIGCRTIGISDAPFPIWWNKYKETYACGIRFKKTDFLNNPLEKIWGAGLTARTKFLKPALLNMDLLCTGRIGDKQMSGEDTELNYRMRLLGAKFYNSNDLYLKHFMRRGRLNKLHLKKTRNGNGLGGINLDIYKYLLTKNIIYKLPYLTILIFLGFIPLSIKYRCNYLKFSLLRFKSLKERIILQKYIKQIFIPIN